MLFKKFSDRITAYWLKKMEKSKDKDINTNLGALAISILVISLVIIIFSFFAPDVFVKKKEYTDTGQIGDTIGGIMNPFIAISGVLLTFLAFFIQFKANKLQQSLFREELDEQKNQFKKTQFENQFYEMINLHKDNVNEFEIKSLKFMINAQIEGEKSEGIIKGRRVFDFLIKELELCYYITKIHFFDSDIETNFNKAYSIFFHGLNYELDSTSEYYQDMFYIKDTHSNNSYSFLNRVVKGRFDIDWEYELNYSIFDGYSSQLAHYYRHLFLTVKFIVSQNEKIITYEDKRRYLRILRAQLSNQEQVMIFYNWFSKYGRRWEDETNKFFTDYRMIHNIYQGLLLSDICLDKIFSINGVYLKESDRDFDPLFEFQDWDN